MIIKPASDAQVKFLRTLMEERELTAHVREMLAAFPVDRLNSHEASVMIELVKKCDRKVTTLAYPVLERRALDEALAAVPKSKYALRFEDIGAAVSQVPSYGNDTLFLEVKEYRQKRYIRRLHGSVGGFSRSRLGTKDSITLLKMIAEDPLVSARLFGTLCGCCGCCGAKLTDEVSRALGFGPECRKRFGL